MTINDQRKLLVRIFGAKSLQFIAIGGPKIGEKFARVEMGRLWKEMSD